jgi:hypothetical protein
VTDPPVPLSGSTLIAGPSGAGKTRTTARALEAWLEREGPGGVVVFEFGPEIERDGRVVGGRLDRFTGVPDELWHGILEAHGPRSEGATEAEVRDLARENAAGATALFDAAPADPRAVFVNDATIPFHHEAGDPDRLLRYCSEASCAVLNALADDDKLGGEDPISRRERQVLALFRRRVDRIAQLH